MNDSRNRRLKDLNDSPAFQAIQEEVGRSRRPAYYLTFPSAAIGTAVETSFDCMKILVQENAYEAAKAGELL